MVFNGFYVFIYGSFSGFNQLILGFNGIQRKKKGVIGVTKIGI